MESVKAYLDEKIEQPMTALVKRYMEDYMQEIKDDLFDL